MSKIRVWITKYALTDGIREVIAEIDGDMASVRGNMFIQCFHGEGKEWHRTLEGAHRKAQQMREAKMISLGKQISKLHDLQIKVHPLERSDAL